MCGLAGILLPAGAPADEAELKAMATALAHRGPDATGTWRTPGVGLAHTRLSLFDLSSAADQPWTGEPDGSDALVFNGEIYNWKELRAELERDGIAFRTSCDTEVLFQWLRTRGVEATLARVEGMFAFAYHDPRTATTYLARDRYGIKPLLYRAGSDGVRFASEVKALLATGPVAVDPTLALMSLRALGDKSPDRTLFRGIRQVEPGGLVRVVDGRVVTSTRYDDLLDGVDPQRYRELHRASAPEVADQFRHLMEASVRKMAACDARLGALFSGGVDSSLLAAIAMEQHQPHFRAFLAEVVGPDSERAHAEAVAGALGLPLRTDPFTAQDWITGWVHATWHLETPVITHPSTVPFGAVAALAHRDGYKAVLTGEGADELFLGYPRLASGGAERLAAAPVNGLRRLYRRVPGLVDVVLNERDMASYDFARGLAGGFEEDAARAEAVARYDFLPPERAAAQARSAVMFRSSLLSLLQRNDRMGMSASIESRFPFLDEAVVRFGLNLPVHHKLRRAPALHDPKHPFVIDKAPVRAVAAAYLGEQAAHRRKAGFPTRGLRGVTVRPGAFAGGWAADAFGGGRSFDREIAAWRQPYDVAKLMSVEIFGRLFDRGDDLDAVQGWVHDNVVATPG